MTSHDFPANCSSEFGDYALGQAPQLCVLARLNSGSTFLSAFSMPSNLCAAVASWIHGSGQHPCQRLLQLGPPHQNPSMNCSFYRWLIHIPCAFHIEQWLENRGRPKFQECHLSFAWKTAEQRRYAQPRPKLNATITNLTSLLQICFTCRRIELGSILC